MPFTWIQESTAHLLATLVGPVVIYQPSKNDIPADLSALASQGLVEIRTPIGRDEDRLQAALAEFKAWARMNPTASVAGAAFFGARQGEIPFFDESTINRIRSDINRYRSVDQQAGDQSAHQVDETEAGFSARLFLALAQDNDMTTARLNHDLKRFKAQEKNFLESLQETDETGFNRQKMGAAIWRDDPGARLTEQRILAWASLAAADTQVPELLVTISPAVIEALLESSGGAIGLKKLGDLRISYSSGTTTAPLGRLLADLAAKKTLSSADLRPVEAAVEPAADAILFVAANRPPADVIRQLADTKAGSFGVHQCPESNQNTLVVLVNE
jgi:hypothetical protein